MQGPITVFDGGVYAGDAKIEDLPPGSQRLISYGLDLDTEVAPQGKAQPEEFLSVRLLKGTMITARKFTRSVEYTVKNSGKKAKTVLVEYPIDPNWTLVKPKEPAEKTRDLYRFAVEAKPGEPAKLTVEQERIDRQQVAIDEPRRRRDPVLSERQGGQRARSRPRWPRSSSGSTRSSRWRSTGSNSSSGSARSARTRPASARTWPNSTARATSTRAT